jgi:hypothetical protein
VVDAVYSDEFAALTGVPESRSEGGEGGGSVSDDGDAE